MRCTKLFEIVAPDKKLTILADMPTKTNLEIDALSRLLVAGRKLLSAEAVNTISQQQRWLRQNGTLLP